MYIIIYKYTCLFTAVMRTGHTVRDVTHKNVSFSIFFFLRYSFFSFFFISEHIKLFTFLCAREFEFSFSNFIFRMVHYTRYCFRHEFDIPKFLIVNWLCWNLKRSSILIINSFRTYIYL